MKKSVLILLFLLFWLPTLGAGFRYMGVYSIEKDGVPLGGVAVVGMLNLETRERTLLAVPTGPYNKQGLQYPVYYYVEECWQVKGSPLGLDGLWVFKMRSLFPGDEHIVPIPYQFWPLRKAEETVKGGLK